MAAIKCHRPKAALLAASIILSLVIFNCISPLRLRLRQPPHPSYPPPRPDSLTTTHPSTNPQPTHPSTSNTTTNTTSPPNPAWHHNLASKLSSWRPWTGAARENEDYYGTTIRSSPSPPSPPDLPPSPHQPHKHHQPPVPRIAKASHLSGAQNPSLERALCTHTLHNAVHGYAHHVAHTALLGPASTKHAHVLSLLLTELAKPAPERVDWVFWFDAGVVVLNPWVGLELFLPPAGDGLDGVEMLCQEGRGLAVFAVRVAEWAVRLFGAVVAEAGVDGDGDGVLRRLRGGERWRGGVVAVPGHWFGGEGGGGFGDGDGDGDGVDEDGDEEGDFEDGDGDEEDDSVARTETPSSSSSSSSPRKPSPLRPGVFVAHFSTLSTDTQTPAAKSKRRMQFWLQRAEQHLPAWEVPVALTGYPQSVDAFWRGMKERRREVQREEEGVGEEQAGEVKTEDVTNSLAAKGRDGGDGDIEGEMLDVHVAEVDAMEE